MVFLFILIALFCPHWWRKIVIKRWRNRLALDKHQSVFSQLYANVDGFALSREARSAHDAIEYIYGERDFASFSALLSLVKPNSKTVFYDLGSGTGKAVLACAMVYNVQKSHGVELFGALHQAACHQLQALRSLPDYEPSCKSIHFIHGNFLHADFKNATLVYINATGFFGTNWIVISERLAQTASCTSVITISKPLKSHAFTVIKITRVQMSWGIVNAYIQQRTKIN